SSSSVSSTSEIHSLSLHDALPILSHRQRTYEVGIQDAADCFGRGCRRRAVLGIHDTCIVDENIEPTMLCANRFGGRCDACMVVEDRKSTRLNSSHVSRSYAVFCLK